MREGFLRGIVEWEGPPEKENNFRLFTFSSTDSFLYSIEMKELRELWGRIEFKGMSRV